MDSRPHRVRTIIALISVFCLLLILQSLAAFVSSPLNMLTRAAGLVGYLSLFLAITAYQYRREMSKMFGRPFLKVHHLLAKVGLAMIIVHPVTYALQKGDPSVLVPVLSSLSDFLLWAGRPALYLFVAGATAGVLRARIKSSWKTIHYLNYLALALACVHGVLLGSDLGVGWLRWLYALMAVAAVVMLFERRWSERTPRVSKAQK
jgi:methionine sulfoxide reductase heme-binding subunit